MKTYIVATGTYCETLDDQDLPKLSPLVKASVGKSVRRISRFIQLALIGSGRAAVNVPRKTSVYLSSCRGDIDVTVNVLDSIYCEGEAPSPLMFINTVSNAATFYVMQCLGLQGSSGFISNRYFALEMALKLACVDLQSQRISSALVGAVDVASLPLSMHRQRLILADESPVAEASHWLQLTREPCGRPVMATINTVQYFQQHEDLSAWLAVQKFSSEIQLALGQHFSDTEAAQWQQKTGLDMFQGQENTAYFDSRVGQILSVFIDSNINGLLYLNRDPHGCYVALLFGR